MSITRSILSHILTMGLVFLATSQAWAGTVHVAVASNFTKTMKMIAADFNRTTGHKALISYGSSGKLMEQIRHGAPFEVFLSADEDKPEKLLMEDLAIADTRFTYALGKLVLWSADEALVDANGDVLQQGSFEHIAMANPVTAPYGEAAKEVMAGLGVADKLKDKVVQGDNIAQTQAFVSSGNAELGFLALSQVSKDGKVNKGSGWLIPAELYQSIRQDAVLLKKGEDSEAAKALLSYLASAEAQATIQSFGYGLKIEDSVTDSVAETEKKDADAKQ